MKLLYFIVSHSLFIAACAAALCFQTAQLLQVTLDAWFYSFIFFSTICSYNFYWLLSGYAFKSGSISTYLMQHRSNVIVLLTAAVGLGVTVFHLTVILPVIAVAAMLTFIYAIPLLPFKWLRFTRNAGLLKTILLAFTWAFITVCIPYVYIKAANTTALLLLFCIRFVFMLMLCIIFDARDTEVDKIRGLQSLTTMLRPQTVKFIMLLLFAAYLIAGIFFRLYFNETKQITAILIIGLTVATVYYYSLKKQGYLFYYFIVDGLMLFSAAVTFIASI